MDYRSATAVDDSWRRVYQSEQTGVVRGATGNTEITRTKRAVGRQDNVPKGAGPATNRTGDPQNRLIETTVTFDPTTPDHTSHLQQYPDELLDLGRRAARLREFGRAPKTISGTTSRSSSRFWWRTSSHSCSPSRSKSRRSHVCAREVRLQSGGRPVRTGPSLRKERGPRRMGPQPHRSTQCQLDSSLASPWTSAASSMT